MAVSIDISKVNISLTEFQKMSDGKYNAGEVKLASETGLKKVNNHVTMKFLNSTKISQVEVLAIKNAFVKALKSGGVGGEELKRVREELGLAPAKAVDRSLRERSIRPLTRQQIREILDRNAVVINEHEGAGIIRTGEEIHAGVSKQTLESRSAERAAVNAELDTRREIVENKSVCNLTAVLAGDVDFAPVSARREMLATARQCLDIVLAGCDSSPSNVNATIQWPVADGKSVALSLGLTEKELVRKLEDIIVRLGMDDNPSREELALRTEFKALGTSAVQASWVANLAKDPDGAFKARVVAVMIMHDRGINDAETLSAVNMLGKDNAIALATNLVSNGMHLEGDALRESVTVQNALACVDQELDLPSAEKAYIPAITDKQYNEEIFENMAGQKKGGIEKLPVTFQKIVREAENKVLARYGTAGYPMMKASYLTSGTDLPDMIGISNPNAPRVAAENIRNAYIECAVRTCASRLIDAGVERLLKDAGIAVDVAMVVSNSVRESDKTVLERVIAANSPEEANTVLDEYKELVAVCGKRAAACDRCHRAIGDMACAAMAAKLGVPAESLSNGVFDFSRLVTSSIKLRNDISAGRIKADTEAGIEAEFKKMVDAFVDARVKIFERIDSTGLSEEAKTEFKAIVLKMDKTSYLNIEGMSAAVKDIPSGRLAELIAANAPKEQIFEAMKEITTAANAAMHKMFAGKEIGTDEISNFLDPVIRLVVLSTPELAEGLSVFLASPAMAEAPVRELGGQDHPAFNFMSFAPNPDANAQLASKLGTDALPAFHVQALEEAVREEGLEGLSTAETIALFRPGRPTGGSLLHASIMDAGMEVSAPMLKKFARAALRECRHAVDAVLQSKAAVEKAVEGFLAGDGAQRALDAGYHKSELPRIARAFALYKVAANATDDAALLAVLDPASNVSRLAGYGGRFMENADNFKAGLALMDKFAQWYADLSSGVAAGDTDTLTKVNATAKYVPAGGVRGYEMFVFQDLAISQSANLDEPEPENLFGVERNDAVNFFARGNGNGCTGTLMQLSPARRKVVYAAFRVLEAPVQENPDRGLTCVQNISWCLARILRCFDDVAKLANSGKLNRWRLNKILAPVPRLPSSATSKDIDESIMGPVYKKYDESPDKLSEALCCVRKGYTLAEIFDAVDNGRNPAGLPELASAEMTIDAIDGTTRGGRDLMLADLCRAKNPVDPGTGQNLLEAGNNRFTVNIGDETIHCASGAPEVNANVADKIEALCGKVHAEQANGVMRGLSQAANFAILPHLAKHGVSTRQADHMPLEYTLSKNEETGAVTIRYSEPAGFPFKFSWETTVALDGTSTTTPVAIEARA